MPTSPIFRRFQSTAKAVSVRSDLLRKLFRYYFSLGGAGEIMGSLANSDDYELSLVGSFLRPNLACSSDAI